MEEYIWDVPAPLATVPIRATDSAQIVLRNYGNPNGPRLVLSHDNGLASDLYYPFWSRLMPDFDLIIYDLRSHGWNPRSALRNHNIPTFVSDNEFVRRAIDLHFGPKPAVGVFHSLSAIVALNEARPGEGWAGLVLFDPPLYPPSGDPYEIDRMWQRCGAAQQYRRAQFRSPAEFAADFRSSRLNERMAPGVAELAGRTLLRPLFDGQEYELRCPPEWQARVFEWAFAYSVDPAPKRFRCPVKVIGGDPTLPFSFVPSDDLDGILGFEYDFVPETTHFLQLEDPEECVATMVDFLEQEGLA